MSHNCWFSSPISLHRTNNNMCCIRLAPFSKLKIDEWMRRRMSTFCGRVRHLGPKIKHPKQKPGTPCCNTDSISVRCFIQRFELSAPNSSCVDLFALLHAAMAESEMAVKIAPESVSSAASVLPTTVEDEIRVFYYPSELAVCWLFPRFTWLWSFQSRFVDHSVSATNFSPLISN